MPLTEFQQEYLRNCSHRWNIKTGATRSGKTYLDCAVTIPKRLCAARGEGLLVLMGNTLGTLERNVLEPMRSLWGAELVGVVRTSASGNVVQLFGQKVYVLGADNKKHIARIQGAAIEYAYGDEITTWDEGVFQMLKSRLSCPHSYFDGTCNPESPTHWFKKFLDSDADLYCQAYTIDDNPTLPAKFVADLKKEYAGTVYYNRYILGQWMAANGVIYRLLADSIAAKDGRFCWPADRPLHPWRVRIGVDFGGNGSKHAFVATAILPGYAGVLGLASQRVDPVAQDADFLADQLLLFCMAVFSRWGEIQYIFCDSAEQTLMNHIKARLRRSRLSWLAERVENSAKIRINDRIRLTCILMGGGRFWLMPEADTLRDALATALWSQKHPGIDERLDDGSTDIDTLDAYEYNFENGKITTATEYTGSRQDLVQSANKNQTPIETALIGILRAILWAAKTFQGANVDPDTAISVDWDDSYITDAETRMGQMRDDALSGILPRYKYLAARYGLSEDAARKLAQEAQNENRQPELTFGGA